MRRRRKATNSDMLDDPDVDAGSLRQRLAETFAELEMTREEAAHHFARARELERRIIRHNRSAGEEAI